MTIQHRSYDCARKVAYEIGMFQHTFSLLEAAEVDLASVVPGEIRILRQVGTGGLYTKHLYNLSAILESFLLHSRVLHEFFCREKSVKEDDLKARHFATGWTFEEAETPYLKEQEKWLHKSLAHLSKARVEHAAEGAEWDLIRIKDEISQLIVRFECKLDADVKGWFSDVFAKKNPQAHPAVQSNNAAIDKLNVDNTNLWPFQTEH